MVRLSTLLTVGSLALAGAANLRGSAERELHESVAPTTAAPTVAEDPVTATDIAVLQFALNLEYLEAEFYSWAAFGYGLPECANVSTGGMKANLSDAYQAYAEEIANNEIAHVRFLQTALGNSSIDCPAINIGTAFSAAADAATNSTLDPPYSPYYDDNWFTLGAFIFEDVGVTAYSGAAPLLSNKAILSAAAGILAVEAYHAGTVRTLLTINKDVLLTPYPITVAQGVQAVSDLRAAVGGGKDAGIVAMDKNSTDASTDAPTDSAGRQLDWGRVLEEDMYNAIYTASNFTGVNSTQIVPADENAIAFARNTSEVLNIVYLSADGTPGGFFPKGLNGAIA